MAEMQDKLSDTGAGISREDSLSSLPETECEWPHLDAAVCETASLSQTCDAGGVWHVPGPPPAPPHPPALPLEACYLNFQVSYLGGIEVRVAPDFDAPRTGLVLMQSEIFAVSQHLQGTDGRIYLCLADGQGWVFDDSALVPHDPSVVQLQYTGLHAMGSTWAEAAPMTAPWDIPLVQATGTELVLPPPLPLPGTEAYGATVAQSPLPPALPSASTAAPPGHAGSQGELLASTPAGIAMSAPRAPSPMSWFRVSYLGGINLRCGPSIDAPLSGFTLPQMETFPVAEEFPAQDGRIYLRLCDGRGWAFDDSALMPLDPSVIRGNWMATQQSNHMVDTRVLQEVQADALPVRRRMHPQPRGKRGGKRCSRRSQGSSAGASSATQG